MRLHPDDRKEQILNAAITVAARPGGWSKLTREAVASEANCTDSLISAHFGTMTEFKRKVMRAAIKSNNLPVIGQGIAAGDKTACKVPDHIRADALKSLAG